ncbi:hypothetical protein [Neobacillus terrae]|uniref:hypothetical protein n=1 Tax=Neobacillus terrae TaxID=3034837 RepID=UPI00140CFB79|nr:hypothetical protein [Neobacillus terrae]NHM29163.1 hypothetical protein [Neobacillus terrae]
MNETVSQKEQVLLMISQISSQLEELENLLDSSFSGLRNQLYLTEAKKIEVVKEQIDSFDKEAQDRHSETLVHTVNSLGLELSF